MHSDGSFLILHGTQAPNRKVSWKDITHNSKYDSENEEIEIEIAGFSFVAFFWRLTYQILPTPIVSRLNFFSFNYTLSVLFKDNFPYSPFGVLALVFMSQDTFIARKLGMTDQQCNQVLLCWKSEDEQMEEILLHWRKEQDDNEDPASLRVQLKDLTFEGQFSLI